MSSFPNSSQSAFCFRTRVCSHSRTGFGVRRREVLPDNKEVRLVSIPVIDCARLSPPELEVLTHCGVDRG